MMTNLGSTDSRQLTGHGLARWLLVLLLALLSLPLARQAHAAGETPLSSLSNSGPLESTLKAVRVTAASLNVRAAPSTGAANVGRLRAGDHVAPLGQSADGRWWRIRYSGRDAYISSVYTVPALAKPMPAGDPTALRPAPLTTPGINGHPTLADLWAGKARFVAEVADTGLPLGESDTLLMENGFAQGQNPSSMGCAYGALGQPADTFQCCAANPLFSGAATYGPAQAVDASTNRYFDFRTISSAEVLRVDDQLYMLYEGVRGPGPGDAGDTQFALGLARTKAGRPDGPWETYPGNPLLVDLPGNVGLGHADLLVLDGKTLFFTSLDGVRRARLGLVWGASK